MLVDTKLLSLSSSGSAACYRHWLALICSNLASLCCIKSVAGLSYWLTLNLMYSLRCSPGSVSSVGRISEKEGAVLHDIVHENFDHALSLNVKVEDHDVVQRV